MTSTRGGWIFGSFWMPERNWANFACLWLDELKITPGLIIRRHDRSGSLQNSLSFMLLPILYVIGYWKLPNLKTRFLDFKTLDEERELGLFDFFGLDDKWSYFLEFKKGDDLSSKFQSLNVILERLCNFEKSSNRAKMFSGIYEFYLHISFIQIYIPAF